MDNNEIQYLSGNAALFHALAVIPQIEPIPCKFCETRTAEFYCDLDIFEIYLCTRCDNERWIAVR